MSLIPPRTRDKYRAGGSGAFRGTTAVPTKQGWRHDLVTSVYRVGPREGGHEFVARLTQLVKPSGDHWLAQWWAPNSESRHREEGWLEIGRGSKEEMVALVELKATEHVIVSLPDP